MAIVVTEADKTRAFTGFFLFIGVAYILTAEGTQAHRLAQLAKKRRCYFARLGSAGLQDFFDALARHIQVDLGPIVSKYFEH